MESQVKPSLLNRILTPTIFVVGGVLALLWFIYRIYILFKSSGDSVVLIDKGSYYMLGVGLGMLALAFIMIWEQWLLRPVRGAVTKIFTRMVVSSLVLLLLLPHVIHYVANNQLKSEGYSICEQANHQWLFVMEIVYVQHTVECQERLKNK